VEEPYQKQKEPQPQEPFNFLSTQSKKHTTIHAKILSKQETNLEKI
jgi:hypothetical protein